MNDVADADNKKVWDELLARTDLIGGQILFHPGKLTVAEIESFHDYGDYVTFRFSWSAAETLRGWTRRHVARHSFDKRGICKDPEYEAYQFAGNFFFPVGHPKYLDQSVVVSKTRRH